MHADLTMSSPDSWQQLLTCARERAAAARLEPQTDQLLWALPLPTRELLALIIETTGCRRVLELGAGQSSLAIARALEGQGGGRLTSIDHAPQFAREAWEAVTACAGVDARLVVAGLGWTECGAASFRSYVGIDEALRTLAPFDLVLIDGPPGASTGRTATLYQVAPHLAPGALVVLDDYQRPDEQADVARWLRDMPSLEPLVLTSTFGRGVAVLRMGDAPRAVSSAHEAR
jgi:predicted O-methyltransferase YrrM